MRRWSTGCVIGSGVRRLRRASAATALAGARKTRCSTAACVAKWESTLRIFYNTLIILHFTAIPPARPESKLLKDQPRGSACSRRPAQGPEIAFGIVGRYAVDRYRQAAPPGGACGLCASCEPWPSVGKVTIGGIVTPWVCGHSAHGVFIVGRSGARSLAQAACAHRTAGAHPLCAPALLVFSPPRM